MKTPSSDERRDWPLSLKLMAALGLVLAPLGVIAALLSANSYQQIVSDRALLAISRFEAFERVIVANLDADFTVLRTALLDAPIDAAENRAIACALLGRVASFDRAIGVATRVDTAGRSVCGDQPLPTPVLRGLRELGSSEPGERFRRLVIADAARDAFWLIVRDDGALAAGDAVVARVSLAALRGVLDPRALAISERLTVTDGAQPVTAWGGAPQCDNGSCIEIERPIGNAGLWLELAQRKPDLTFAQASSIGLPLVMWLVAAAIGWATTQRLVARPVVRLQRAIERYRRGDAAARVGSLGLQSREMEVLGAAFDRMADDLGARAEELNEALAEQRRLTREVHHRVKNNLQIIASLLSIESRNVPPEAAHGYAAMQARVSALALVHRLVYDDAGARAIDARALLTGLAAALEQPLADDRRARLTVDAEPLPIDQDTAVPLAFLVTELVGLAASQADGGSGSGDVEAAISVVASGGVATLCASSPAFAEDLLELDGAEPHRVLAGLVRQLRGALAHDGASGYRVTFALPELRD